ncbi:BTAD domain-containing putative transcriptional regulator [Streptomonospora nanhaiensis]|uniref:AfsR/SARP family transcriptional regulator n=1 Tax=Streptomonospora nanhaiensis TaxID=1323731 RepID=UPI001C99BAB0|nr:BTAD domain-containing putative transcriptional regulator [Streptomonospora nanhaiensis]MBX9386910.1 tetratricopeptide repeat protein [Streptomonospora nanhaiensis]
MEIRLLGPSVRIMVDGESVDAGTPKERSILANLALEPGKVVPTQLIIDRVWGDTPTPRVRSSLYAYITRLRGRLAAAGAGSGVGLRSRSQGYLLEIAKEAVDWHRAELLRVRARALADSGDHRAAVVLLSEALDLWEGHPLAEISGAWAEGVRTNMLKSWSLLVQRWAESSMRIGHFDDVVTRVSEAAAADPVNERLAAVLMEALAGSGRHAEALEVHARLRADLADRLGIDPGPDTQAVFERILRGGAERRPEAGRRIGPADTAASGCGPDQANLAGMPQAGAPEPAPLGPEPTGQASDGLPRLLIHDNLPRDTANFTARTAELAEIVARVRGRPDTTTAIVIHGMAGRGKTTLAVRAAHAVRAEFHTRLFLDLCGHADSQPPLKPEQGIYKLLLTVGVPAEEIPSEPEARAALWTSRLAGRRTLLVLDDAIEPQIGPLLPGLPGCTVLVTSRRRLAEVDGVHHLELAPLDRNDSALMFSRTAGLDLGADSAVDGAVQRITAACEGLPLAIRVAGGRLRRHPGWTPRYLADRIERNGLAEIRSMSHDIAGVFATSYQALSEETRRGFLLLGGLHPSDAFSVPAAAAALGDTSETFTAAEAAIEELLDTHLIEETGPERYRMHALLREFARDRAAEEMTPEERREALLRIIDFYWAAADSADRTVHPGRRRPAPPPSRPSRLPEFGGALAARHWYETEYPVLEAVMACARECEFSDQPELRERAAHLPLCLGGLFGSDGPWESAERHLSAALELWMERGDGSGAAIAAFELSRVQRRSNLAAAAESVETALAEWRGAGDALGEAEALDLRGMLSREAGRNAAALRDHEAALTLYTRVGDERGRAQALSNIGVCQASLGDSAAAESAFSEARRLWQAVGDKHALGDVIANMAGVQFDRGYYRHAQRQCRKSLRLFQDLGDRRRSAVVLYNVGDIALYRDRNEEALDCFLTARRLLWEVGDEQKAAGACSGIGKALLALGRPNEAEDVLTQALALEVTKAVPVVQSQLMLALGDVSMALQRLDDAWTQYRSARALAGNGASAADERMADDRLGDLCARLGRPDEARSHWRRALALAERAQTPQKEAIRIKIELLGHSSCFVA